MLFPILIPLLLWLASLPFSLTAASTAYESIYTIPDFALQQTCAQQCFTQGYDNIACYTDVLGSLLGCPNTPCSATFAAVDACYCREDLQTAAHDILSSCIDQLCSIGDNSVNLATALSIYSGYCSARGFVALPASNAAETTSLVGGAVATTAGSGAGPTSAAPGGSTSTSSTTPASTSNTLTIALACVIAVAVLAILALGITCWKKRQNPKRNKLESPSPYHTGPVSVSSDLLPLTERPNEVGPNDSVSNYGGHSDVMGRFYPSRPEESMVGTNVGGPGGSMMGGRRNMPRDQGGAWR
jgi:hypothetical protein